MKFINLRFFLILLFIFILGLLALPQFQLKIGDSIFTYPNIDFSLIESKSKLGNFQRSFGIYPSKEFSADVVLDASKSDADKQKEFENILDIINKRLAYASLYDLKVRGEFTSGKYSIKLTFPDYYTEADKLAKYILGKGEISFIDYVNQSPLNLKDYDIEGSINSAYDERNLINVLEFKFKEDKTTDIVLATSNEQKVFIMVVDSASFAVGRNDTIPNLVKAFPLVDITERKNIAIYLNIVKTYFASQPISSDITLTSTPKNIPGSYSAENLRFTSFMFFVSGVALLLASIFVFKKNFIKFGLMLSSFVLLTVVFLKLQSAALSISTVIGFIFIYIVGSIIVWQLMKTEEDNINNELLKFRDLMLLSVIVLLIVWKLNITIGSIADFVGTVLLGSFAMLISILLVFKTVLYWDVPTKLPFIRFKK